jgi:hypothetical protein
VGNDSELVPNTDHEAASVISDNSVSIPSSHSSDAVASTIDDATSDGNDSESIQSDHPSDAAAGSSTIIGESSTIIIPDDDTTSEGNDSESILKSILINSRLPINHS